MNNGNNFFIEDGFLLKTTSNFIKKYCYLGETSKDKVNDVLHVLNTNIKHVKIYENSFENNISIFVKNKEYIKAVFNDGGEQQLFIFDLDKGCEKCPKSQ
jgi:hypothetical protein